MLGEEAIRGHIRAAFESMDAENAEPINFATASAHLKAAELELGIQKEKAHQADEDFAEDARDRRHRELTRTIRALARRVGVDTSPPDAGAGPVPDGMMVCPVCQGACSIADVETPRALVRCAACNGQGRVMDHGPPSGAAPLNTSAAAGWGPSADDEIHEALQLAEDLSVGDLGAAQPHYIRAIALMLARDFGVRHRLE